MKPDVSTKDLDGIKSAQISYNINGESRNELGVESDIEVKTSGSIKESGGYKKGLELGKEYKKDIK